MALADESIEHVDKPSRLAVTADAGVPDGFMGGVLVRATGRLHFSAGVGHNTMSTGVRVGARLDAFTARVTPYIAADYGRYFEGDAQPWARSIASRMVDDADLQRVSYRFINAHLGFRFGKRGAVVFFQGGFSHIKGSLVVRDQDMSTSPLEPDVEVLASSSLNGWVPAARFGFAAFF